MEPNVFLWGGVLAIVAVGGACLYSKGDVKKIFLNNKHTFEPLISLLPTRFNIQDWTVKIVDINDKFLTRWWITLVKKNSNNEELIRKELLTVLTRWGVEIPKEKKEKPINWRAAGKAFVKNIDIFAPILNTLNDNTFDFQSWTALIVTVNDQELTEAWKQCVKSDNVKKKWMQVLASWQLKCDTCRSFTCLTMDNMTAYSLPDGGPLAEGVKYRVEYPCWVLTAEDADGNVIKTVVTKGIVVPFENV